MKSKILIALIAILFASCTQGTTKNFGTINSIESKTAGTYKIYVGLGTIDFYFVSSKLYTVGDTVYFTTSKELIK